MKLMQYLSIAALAVAVVPFATPAMAGFQVAVEAPAGLNIIIRVAAGDTYEDVVLVHESPEPLRGRDEAYGVYVENIDLELEDVSLICVTDVTQPITADTVFACTEWGKDFPLYEGFDMPIVKMEYLPPDGQ